MQNKFNVDEIVKVKKNGRTEVCKITFVGIGIMTGVLYEAESLESDAYFERLLEKDIEAVPLYCLVIKEANGLMYVVKNGVKVSKAEKTIEDAVKNAYRTPYKYETLYGKIANDYNNIVNSIFNNISKKYTEIYLIQFDKECKYFIKKQHEIG